MGSAEEDWGTSEAVRLYKAGEYDRHGDKKNWWRVGGGHAKIEDIADGWQQSMQITKGDH